MDVQALLRSARALSRDASRVAQSLRLEPTWRAYNVHAYAWPCYEAFVRRYLALTKRPIVALAMNPGKYGAVQTGIPFTDVARARELLPEYDQIRPRRTDLPRPGREQSGRRVYAWGLRRFGSYGAMFRGFVVLVTCPLAVLDWNGTRAVNVPLPKLPRKDRQFIVGMIHRRLPRLLNAVAPRGVLLLGTWARDTWPDIELPTGFAPHPAAHIPDAEWIDAMDRAYRRLTDAR